MKSLFPLMIIIIIFSSCQKSVETSVEMPADPMGTGSVTFNGQSYPVKYAYLEIDTVTARPNKISFLTISSLDYYYAATINDLTPNVQPKYNGYFTDMSILFDTTFNGVPPVGIYNFHARRTVGYSNSSNFYDSHSSVNTNVINGIEYGNNTFDIELLNTNSSIPSTVSIVKTGADTYTINYSIRYAGRPIEENIDIVTGTYTGRIQVVYVK